MNNNQDLDPGFIVELLTKGKLIFNLMKDGETPGYLKLLPLAAIAYWIFPFEGLIAGPFSLPLGTPLDDIAVLLVAMNAFLKLVPAHLVSRYSTDYRDNPTSPQDDNIIDSEFFDKDDFLE